MTKKEQEIYNWLVDHPGYLKKSALYLKNEKFNNYKLQNVYDSLLKARIDYKKAQNHKITGLDLDSSITDSPAFGWNVRNYLKEHLQIDSKRTLTVRGVNIPKQYKSSFKQQIITGYNPNNVLAIADLHEPFCRDGYLEHCIKIRDKYKCGTIVLIGDEVDLCGISQWEKDPDGFSAGTEAALAQEKMKLWYEAFPEAYVCIGNHTARPFRMAKQHGIPKKFIKSYEEAWEAPKTWKWAENWEFNGVLYTHGTGFSGANAAIKIASMHRQNTVIGHIHSEAGIQFNASKIDIIWGMQLGGALDDKSYAAFYAKDQLKKSIVGCGVILDGRIPIYEPMLM